MFYLKVILLLHSSYPFGALLDSRLLVHTLENEDGVFLDRTTAEVSSLDVEEDCKSLPPGAMKTSGDKVGGPLSPTVESTGLYCCNVDMSSSTGGMNLSGESGSN